MASLTEFFNKHEDEALKGIIHKNSLIKRNIITYMAVNGECTLSELTKELQDYVKHQTAPYKYPRIVEFVSELPKTISGKIRRVELREQNQK